MQRRHFLTSAVLLAGSACNRQRKTVIGVVPKGANHVFWQTVHAGAIKAARESGFEIEWNAPALEIDSSRQVDIVESMVNRRLSGIVLAPVDRKALVHIVERAAREGVPVVIFDSGVDTNQIVSYVATDNQEGGRIGALRLGRILGGKGKVGYLGFMPGSASTMEREQGFHETMKSLFPDVEIVALQYGMADRAKAMSAAENILTAHPDLSGFFTDNESSTVGAAQAIKSRDARQVKMVGFDASEPLIADMKAGWIDSIVVQNPFKMGYESTRVMAQHLRGENPPRLIDSGVALLTPENADSAEMKEYIAPGIEQWLNLDR